MLKSHVHGVLKKNDNTGANSIRSSMIKSVKMEDGRLYVVTLNDSVYELTNPIDSLIRYLKRHDIDPVGLILDNCEYTIPEEHWDDYD